MPLPQVLDPSNTVLFLGSGFSASATNIARTNPPVGKGLAEEFERQLGLSDTQHGLKVLADELARRPDGSLYQTLYRLFTVSALSAEQLEILSRRWLRVFTTNYDDAVEFASQVQGPPRQSFSWDDPIPKRIPSGSIIHVHGVIRKTTEANVLEQLVLNDNSYIRQHFEQSPWYAELDRALDHCAACFFVGYSLSDYHIAALLLQKPSRRSKVFFVSRSMPDEITRRQLEQFGEIHPIGVEGFAKLCRELPPPAAITDVKSLRRLRYVDPFRDQKAALPPTPAEVLRLVTYGEFNAQRCLTNLPASTYVVTRDDKASEAAEALKKAKTLLLHSYLGNGKTIFLTILAHKLSTLGYKSFVCSSVSSDDIAEIRALKGQEKVVVLFDSYDLALRATPIFEEELPDAKYVVTVRTGVQEVRLHEVHDKLPAPIARIALNGISDAERQQFKELLDRAGVLGDLRAEIERRSDFREIVTSLYKHQLIRQKIGADVAPLLADDGARPVLIAGLLLSWAGYGFEPALIRSITGRDPYVELKRHAEVSSEIFRLDEDTLDVRSSVFAEYLLTNHCGEPHVLEVVERLIVAAVQRKRERLYAGMLGKLMRVATLKTILTSAGKLEAIEAMFQRLQRDIEINAEPLFWLQYAILASEQGEYDQAEGFLSTAYSRAEGSPGFQTYQIDTYALGLLLGIETRSTSVTVDRFADILAKSELVLSMINDQSRRLHAIEVLGGLEPFVRLRAHALSIADRNALVFQLNRLANALGELTVEVRAETGSDVIKRKLESAVRQILSLGSPAARG